MLVVEIGETSSPPPPLIVSEETNEVCDSDMSDNYDLIAYKKNPIRPNWVPKTIQAVGELVENSSDTGRTRSQFESALSVKEPFFDDKCFLMIEYGPQTYE